MHGAVGQRDGSERPIFEQEVKQIVLLVDDQIQDATLALKGHDIDYARVVVGVEHQQFVVNGKVEQPVGGIRSGCTDFEFKRHQRHEGVCGSERLENHLCDDRVGG